MPEPSSKIEKLSPKEILEDVQHLIALRPTDLVTGTLMGPPHSVEYVAYRKALQDIAGLYDGVANFQDAMRDSGINPEQEIARAAAPVVPNVMAGPPAEMNLARFAADMMMAQGPQGAPGAAAPGMADPMQPRGPLPAAGGMAQNAGLPGSVPRRGTGMIG